jgi:hypothetical protein
VRCFKPTVFEISFRTSSLLVEPVLKMMALRENDDDAPKVLCGHDAIPDRLPRM